MVRVLALVCFAFIAAPLQAQEKAVCDLLTDPEVGDLLGQSAVQKRTIVGAANDCVWFVKGFSLTVSRVVDEPATAQMMVDTALKNVRQGDKAKEEPGIGQRAASTVSWTGRGLSMVVATGGTAWTLVLDKLDQKIDVEKALPKLRALAKKLAG